MFSDMLKNKWVTYMAFGVIVAVDFVIASSLCYLLATSRTGFSRRGTVFSLIWIPPTDMEYLALIHF